MGKIKAVHEFGWASLVIVTAVVVLFYKRAMFMNKDCSCHSTGLQLIGNFHLSCTTASLAAQVFLLSNLHDDYLLGIIIWFLLSFPQPKHQILKKRLRKFKSCFLNTNTEWNNKSWLESTFIKCMQNIIKIICLFLDAKIAWQCGLIIIQQTNHQ